MVCSGRASVATSKSPEVVQEQVAHAAADDEGLLPGRA